MFTDPERMVYGPYWTGMGTQSEGRYADPLALHRGLYEALPDLNGVIAQLERQPEPDAGEDVKALAVREQLAAAGKLVPVVAQVFGLTLLDRATGDGCTESYCLRLLNDYLDWCERQKKSPSNSATSSPATIAGQPVAR